MLKLETSNLLAEFNEQNGSLCRLTSKLTGWDILGRPHLGLSWRMMLPVKDHRNNNAWGHLQENAPECTVGENSIAFRWKGITSELGITHEITVTTVCKTDMDQLVFSMHIENGSEGIVENVYYPYLGDLHRPAGAKRFTFSHAGYCQMNTFEMYPTFRNMMGTWSTLYPTMKVDDTYTCPPMMPYGLAEDDRGNGLCVCVAEKRIEALTWHAEAHPGWRNSNDFRVFDTDEAAGKDVFVRFAPGHLPFIEPGKEMELLPFALEAYTGGWAKGTACCTKRSKSWVTLPKETPKWIHEPHSWLQFQMNSAEDELRIPFKDLPRVIGEECRKYGVDAIQLVGWNHGGQDRGNPSHDPDPRLGTREELKEAIRQIRAMGVKLILFVKFTWADVTREDYDEVYKPLTAKDPYGNAFGHGGYQYMTLSQSTNISTRRFATMCFGSDEYLAICRREFQKVIDLEPDGVLFDECQHHNPTLCCFDTSHGHRYGAPTYSWDSRFAAMLREMVQGKEFVIAGEALYDFQFSDYDLGYGRTWGREHKPVTRLLRPEGEFMTAVTGFEDRAMINQCLMNRYVISYEPYNFKGKLSDFPLTVAYGKKMDTLRTDLRKYFWDGEFMEKLGGTVKTENGADHPYYSLFCAHDGKLGMVLVNYDETEPVTLTPALANGQKLTHYRLVDGDALIPFAGSITLPPDSAAAVI